MSAILCLAVGVAALQFMFPSGVSAQACAEPFKRPAYKTRQQHCSPGDMVQDAYSPNEMVRCEDMEVDHLVSLYHAWTNGVCGEDLKRLANDDRNLRFTHWQTNRRKGSLSPEEFADTLPDRGVARQVRKDAKTLMNEFNIPVVPKSRAARLERLSRELDASRRQLNIANVEMSNLNAQVRRNRAAQDRLNKSVSDTIDKISSRTVNRAGRNSIAVFAESIPFVGVGVVLAVTALELNDSCYTLKDLRALELQLNPDATHPEQVKEVCGKEVPPRSEVWEAVKSSPGKAWEDIRAYLPSLGELQLPQVSFEGSWETVKDESSSAWLFALDNLNSAWTAMFGTTE